MNSLLAPAIVCSLLLVGCGQANQSSQISAEEAELSSESTIAAPSNITVSAAASLTDAMEDIKVVYQQQQPETNIIYNFASSGSLQQQIEQGAPVDVFVSAASKQMNELEAKQLLKQDTRKNLLENRLVLIVSTNIENISKFEDLKSDRINKIAIGEPGSVPAGKYAREVFDNLKIADRLESKTIFAKNVRQVLTYVETENVDAGIVYATDAKKSTRVEIAAVAPKASHSPIVYPVAVVEDTRNSEASEDFVEFLSSNSAGKVFEKHGFALTEESANTALTAK